MMQSVGYFFAERVRRFLPDSFVFAVLLTLLGFGMALTLTDRSGSEILDLWVTGLYNPQILVFAIFMIMVLSFGHSLGDSPPVQRFFRALAARFSSPLQVYLLIAISSLLLNLINWALAPVCALFTVELCKRVKGVDYRLACAALYSGMLIWHGGLSSSAALMLASDTTAQGFIDQGLINDVLPVTETLLHPLNLSLIACALLLLPILIIGLRPPYHEEYDAALKYDHNFDIVGKQVDVLDEGSLADKLNRAWWINASIATLGFLGLAWLIREEGFGLSAMSLLMFSLAVLFQSRPLRFVHAMREAISGSSDIVIQFPLFGGIMGIFMGSGLAELFAANLLELASADTLPWFAFVSAASVNLFIPSGGGEWLVLGPSLLEATNAAGADIAPTVLGFAYGDALTNLMNPFWTLTFLPIMGRLIHLRTRDFMGYTVFICLVFFIVESLILLLF